MFEMNWIYDEDTGRYVVKKSARVQYPNFQGQEQDYNAAGRRNFNLRLDKALADELSDRGVHVRTLPPRDDEDEERYLVKIGVYRDADIRLLSGKAMTNVLIENDDRGLPTSNDQGRLVDEEFRKGHVKNGEIGLEFHVSKNTRVASAAPYLRVDTMVIPIRKSRLLEDYEEYDDMDDDQFED